MRVDPISGYDNCDGGNKLDREGWCDGGNKLDREGWWEKKHC